MSKTEDWGKRGEVVVTRDEHGRFKTWRKAVSTPEPYFDEAYEAKSVAIYGYSNVDGGKKSRRFEFTGKGRDLYRAVRLAQSIVPSNKKRFVSVSAREFLSRPYCYGVRGVWVDKEIES
jgi:hypothetical protein